MRIARGSPSLGQLYRVARGPGEGFLFSDRGDVELRGFEDPVRVYEVKWRDG